ncbi:hypothetical protein BSL78_20734 [Apostichopus japonicus]|uniref:Uncharacterized protein n=1 Tax=Stichopus japonicus TaxID=307972 RepID=A0A2G8K325_STIJA|nr:hypothetical protein BSL78_20734 [Apostichopus japonicus]
MSSRLTTSIETSKMAAIRFICLALLVLTATIMMVQADGCVENSIQVTPKNPNGDNPTCKMCKCVGGEWGKCTTTPGSC